MTLQSTVWLICHKLPSYHEFIQYQLLLVMISTPQTCDIFVKNVQAGVFIFDIIFVCRFSCFISIISHWNWKIETRLYCILCRSRRWHMKLSCMIIVRSDMLVYCITKKTIKMKIYLFSQWNCFAWLLWILLDCHLRYFIYQTGLFFHNSFMSLVTMKLGSQRKRYFSFICMIELSDPRIQESTNWRIFSLTTKIGTHE